VIRALDRLFRDDDLGALDQVPGEEATEPETVLRAREVATGWAEVVSEDAAVCVERLFIGDRCV
jgi:hypothetical protein